MLPNPEPTPSSRRLHKVPMWTVPIALGTGNCVILKPSEKVPLTMAKVCELMAEAGVPPGVFQTVKTKTNYGGGLWLGVEL